MKKFLAFTAFAAGMAALALTFFPDGASASHSWGNYHWGRTSNPPTIKLGNNLSTVWRSYLTTASSDWNKSTVIKNTVVAGQSNSRCAMTSGQVEVCNGAYGQNGWLGLASISASSSHITQGSVKMNDTYFAMAQYNTTAERNHVMCQEVGHTFGLGHQDTSGATLGTCMDYSQSTSSQHPNAHDYDQLKTIYNSHLDSSNTWHGLTLADPAANLDMNSPANWGKLIEKSGHSSLYMRDFGNDQRVFTFVEWAVPHGK
jgi:hypothetical protein